MNLHLNKELFKDFIDSVKTGSTIPHLTQEKLVSLNIPIPSIKEQEEVIKILYIFLFVVLCFAIPIIFASGKLGLGNGDGSFFGFFAFVRVLLFFVPLVFFELVLRVFFVEFSCIEWFYFTDFYHSMQSQ